MKAVNKVLSAAFVGAVLIASTAQAATGSLYSLDAWEHPTEGHMSAFETDVDKDAIRSPGGGSVNDPWGVDINSN